MDNSTKAAVDIIDLVKRKEVIIGKMHNRKMVKRRYKIIAKFPGCNDGDILSIGYANSRYGARWVARKLVKVYYAERALSKRIKVVETIIFQ